MHKSKITLVLFFCFYTIIGLGQIKPNTIEQVLVKKNQYFNIEREIIHLHTNKTTYTTNEEIWFKAYIISNLHHKPFTATKNLYLTLYNELGDKIDHKLYLTEKGVADGAFTLPKDLFSGDYILMASTAHQNNFKEDERFYKKINIQNNSQPNITETPDQPQKYYDIQILPEGGNLLEGTINTCGIKIINQQGAGVQEVNSKLYKQGSKNPVTTVYLNRFGMGKFSFTPLPDENYYVISNIGDTEIITDVPNAQKRGVLLKSSFHPTKPLLIVELITNGNTLPTIRNKEFHILIHQYQKTIGLSASFTGEAKDIKLAAPLENLNYGTNTISLFDEKYNPISERLIFNDIPYKSITSEIVKINSKKDSVHTSFRLKSENNKIDHTSISVSILPTETIANDNSGCIINSIYLQPFVKGYVENSGYYFQNSTKRKKHELDVLLLTQGWSKYDWKSIFNGHNLPPIRHEEGITLKGAINITNTVNGKLLVNSRKNQFTEIISSRQDMPLRIFELENLVFQDSTKVHFALINDKNKVSNANVKASIKSFKPSTYNEKAFTIASTPVQNYFSEINSAEIDPNQKLFKSTEQLETVVVTGKKYANKGLYWLNQDASYVPEDMRLTSNLMNYLNTKHFNVIRVNTSFSTERTFTGLFDAVFGREYRGGFKTYPFIVNGALTHPELANQIRLKDASKIYIRDRAGTSPLILVYWSPNANNRSPVNSFVVTNGFQAPKKFYMPKYQSYDSLFFKQYGILGWVPNIQRNTNDEYEFSFKNALMQEARIFIEGMDQDGNLISEVKVLSIPTIP
ncbi:hypothetical protein ACWGOQ_0003955 [Aquimarina sp. M1]